VTYGEYLIAVCTKDENLAPLKSLVQWAWNFPLNSSTCYQSY